MNKTKYVINQEEMSKSFKDMKSAIAKKENFDLQKGITAIFLKLCCSQYFRRNSELWFLSGLGEDVWASLWLRALKKATRQHDSPHSPHNIHMEFTSLFLCLLAPTGALIVMIVYYTAYNFLNSHSAKR